MAVRARFKHFYECDTEGERDLSWGADTLLYTIDTDKYWKIYAGGFVEVPQDEVIFASPIPLSKISISGVPSGTKYLRDDGSWAESSGGAVWGGITGTIADQLDLQAEFWKTAGTSTLTGSPTITRAAGDASQLNFQFGGNGSNESTRSTWLQTGVSLNSFATDNYLLTNGGARVALNVEGSNLLNLTQYGAGGSTKKEIAFTGVGSNWTVTDNMDSKGLVYAADYSANFTDRSLIDKGFADGEYWKTSGTSTITAPSTTITGTSTNGLIFNFATPSIFYASLGSTYSAVFDSNTTSGGIEFRTGSVARNRLFWLSTNAVYLNQGQFGIGGAPTGGNTFDVQGTARIATSLVLGATTATAGTRLDVIGISGGTNIARFANNLDATMFRVLELGPTVYEDLAGDPSTTNGAMWRSGSNLRWYTTGAYNIPRINPAVQGVNRIVFHGSNTSNAEFTESANLTFTGGNLLVSAPTATTARLSVKGAGSGTGVTFSLENSTTASTFQVLDNGGVFIKAAPAAGTTEDVLVWNATAGEVRKVTQASLGGSSPLTTKGDIYTYDTGDARLPVGTDGYILTADSAEATGLKWIAAGGGGDMILASIQTVTGAKTFGTIGGAVGKFILAGSTSGSTIVNAAAVAGSTTVTFQGVTGTVMLVGDAPTAHTHPWGDITGTPTTIAGYGITDAYTKTESDGNYWKTASGGTLTGANVIDLDGNTLEFTNSASPLLINRTTAGTTATVQSPVIRATTSGNMTNGFGVYQAFQIEDNAATPNTIARIGAYRTNGVDNSGKIFFNPFNGGTEQIDAMVINYNGSVGIGISTPTASTRLDVVGILGGTNIARFANNAGTPKVTIAETGTTTFAPTTTSDGIIISANTGSAWLGLTVDNSAGGTGTSGRIKFNNNSGGVSGNIYFGSSTHSSWPSSLALVTSTGGIYLAPAGNLFLSTTPAAGAAQDILVWDGTAGEIRKITQASLTGNETITLSGDVTGSGTTSITTTIAAGTVDIAMLSATGTPDGTTFLRGDNTWAAPAGGGDMLLGTAQTVTAAKTFNVGTLLLDDSDSAFNLILGSTSTITTANKTLTFDVNDADRTLTIGASTTLSGGTHSGTNTGDQTSIVGISGTKAEFDTALSDGNFLYVGDIINSDYWLTASGGTLTGANTITLGGNLLDFIDSTPALRISSTTNNTSSNLNFYQTGAVAAVTGTLRMYGTSHATHPETLALVTSRSAGNIKFAVGASNFVGGISSAGLYYFGGTTPTASTRLDVVGISGGTNIARFADNSDNQAMVIRETRQVSIRNAVSGNIFEVGTVGNRWFGVESDVQPRVRISNGADIGWSDNMFQRVASGIIQLGVTTGSHDGQLNLGKMLINGTTIAANTSLDVRGIGGGNAFRIGDSGTNAEKVLITDAGVATFTSGSASSFRIQNTATTTYAIFDFATAGVSRLIFATPGDVVSMGVTSTTNNVYVSANQIHLPTIKFTTSTVTESTAAQMSAGLAAGVLITAQGASNKSYYNLSLANADGMIDNGTAFARWGITQTISLVYDSGSSTYSAVRLNDTINQTWATAPGRIVTGIEVTPTYTAATGDVYAFYYNPTTPGNITGNHYAFYSTAGLSYLEHDSAPLIVNRTTSVTNTLVQASVDRATTSANMADGFGVYHSFQVEDDTSGALTIGRLGSIRTTADNTSDMFFNVWNGGSEQTKLLLKSNSHIETAINAVIGPAGNGALYLKTNNVVKLSIRNNGESTWDGSVATSGAFYFAKWNAPAHTGQTAAEVNSINFDLSRTLQFTGATGFALQREYLIQAPTYAFVSPTGTITDAYTFYVDGAPAAGTNATITNSWAAGFGGNVQIGGTGKLFINTAPAAGTTEDVLVYGAGGEIMKVAQSALGAGLNHWKLDTASDQLPTASLTFNGTNSYDIDFINVRVTFNSSASRAGLNVGDYAGDPTPLVNGDLWRNSTTGNYRQVVGGTAFNVPRILQSVQAAGRVVYHGANTNNAEFTESSLFTYHTTNGLVLNSQQTHAITTSVASTVISLNASGASSGVIQMLTSSIQRQRLFWTTSAGTYFETAGVGIGAAPTAGYAFDVNGTSLFRDNVTISNGGTPTLQIIDNDSGRTASAYRAVIDARDSVDASAFRIGILAANDPFTFEFRDEVKLELGVSSATLRANSATGISLLTNTTDTIFYEDDGTTVLLQMERDSGNVGLGTSDIETWSTNFGAIEMPTSGIYYDRIANSNVVGIVSNAYLDSGATWKYKTTDAVAIATVDSNNGFTVYTVASGTIDTTASITSKFQVGLTGLVYIKTAPAAGTTEDVLVYGAGGEIKKVTQASLGGGWSASGATTITGNTSQTGDFNNNFNFISSIFGQRTATSGSPYGIRFIGAAHTTLTASVEVTDIDFDFSRSVQWATGALTLQRAFRVQQPTYAFVGASTITDAYSLYIDGAPVAGTNATITNSWAAGFAGDVHITGNSDLVFGDSGTGADAQIRVLSSAPNAQIQLLGKGAGAILLGSEFGAYLGSSSYGGSVRYIQALGSVADISIQLTPKGVGNVSLGTMTLDSDQTIGAGQDNYVLTYDNGTGLVSLEAAAGGGGTIGGSITDNQIAFGATTANTIEGNANFTYNGVGAFNFTNTTAATNAYFKIENTIATQQAALQLKTGTTNADWIMYIPGSSTTLEWYRGATLMQLTSVGDLVLGTTQLSSAHLTLYNAIDQQLALGSTSASGSPYIGFFQSTVRKGYIEYANSQLGFNIHAEVASGNIRLLINSAERFRIAGNGQIGLSGANYGTTGQAIVSTGASTAPTWQSVLTGGVAVNQIPYATATNVVAGDTLFLWNPTSDYMTIGASTNFIGRGNALVTGASSSSLGIRGSTIWIAGGASSTATAYFSSTQFHSLYAAAFGTTAGVSKVTISNTAGTNAPTSLTAANAYLALGNSEYNTNGLFMMGMGYRLSNTHYPAYMGFLMTSTAGATLGSIAFYTRNVTTDTAPPKAMTLTSAGALSLDIATTGIGTAVDWVATSDRRLKENIISYGPVMDKVRSMNGMLSLYNRVGGDVRELGMIAQDVNTIFPELIGKTNEGMYSLSYSRMGAIALQAVVEVDDEVTKLKKRVSELEKEAKQLKAT